MRVQAFENIGSGKFRGLQEDDRLRLAYEGYIHDDGDTEAALEAVFAFLNQDDRPNRKIRPSLSVGDVITFIGGPSRRLESWAVERVGFAKCTLRVANFADRLHFSHEQNQSGVKNIVRIA